MIEKRYYVALMLNKWKSLGFECLDNGSVGFLAAYDNEAELRKDYPNADMVVVKIDHERQQRKNTRNTSSSKKR